MISFDALADSVLEAAVRALAQGTRIVEARAKSHAPVRNIFGTRYQFRPKSIEELELSKRAVGQATYFGYTGGEAGTFGQTVAWERYATARVKTKQAGKLRVEQHWNLRREETAQKLLVAYDAEMQARRRGYAPMKTMLTRRGASEVRTKRANYMNSKGVVTVGGRLKGEIDSIMPTLSGNYAEARVISPTPYAKYMEFGTRHNRAHPFLRPATEESRAEVISLIGAAVNRATRTGIGSTEIEIVVRL